MALNKSKLEDAIGAAFKKAKDENLSSKDVAAELAAAIHAYVSAADVVDITTSVTVSAQNNHTHTGTGKQTGVGKLQ